MAIRKGTSTQLRPKVAARAVHRFQSRRGVPFWECVLLKCGLDGCFPDRSAVACPTRLRNLEYRLYRRRPSSQIPELLPSAVPGCAAPLQFRHVRPQWFATPREWVRDRPQCETSDRRELHPQSHLARGLRKSCRCSTSICPAADPEGEVAFVPLPAHPAAFRLRSRQARGTPNAPTVHVQSRHTAAPPSTQAPACSPLARR